MAEARALVGRGYVQLARHLPVEAGASLHAALETAERLQLAYLVVEAEAALAQVALQRGEQAEACRRAGQVLEALGRPDLLGSIQPSDVYLSCWHVLQECGDARAAAALDAARAYLDNAAALIDDDEMRESFLHNVPANVELPRG